MTYINVNKCVDFPFVSSLLTYRGNIEEDEKTVLLKIGLKKKRTNNTVAPILLITAAGGLFGTVIKETGVGDML